MSDSGFKLSYSWEELRPVHPLYVTALVFQAAGGALNFFIQKDGDWFTHIWTGAALATFAGFLIGLVVQNKLRPGSIAENRQVIIFIGFISLLLAITAVALLNGAQLR